MPEETQRPTRKDLKRLSGLIKITPLLRRTEINPATLRKVLSGQPRALHPHEREQISAALTELRDDIDEVLRQ